MGLSRGSIGHSARTFPKFIFREEDRADHVAMAAFRYNTSTHSATGKTPYEAVFACKEFEFDAGLGLDLRMEQANVPFDLPTRLQHLHKDLPDAGHRSRDAAEKFYRRAVDEMVYKAGEYVVLFSPPGLTDIVRKLHPPRTGPCVVDEVLSSVSVNLTSLHGDRKARAHFNRLRHFDVTKHAGAAIPTDRM
jgi:hypothetical protein